MKYYVVVIVVWAISFTAGYLAGRFEERPRKAIPQPKAKDMAQHLRDLGLK